jgi:peptidoglycan hydrolase-like protein with peptidoglycan-binding domain
MSPYRSTAVLAVAFLSLLAIPAAAAPKPAALSRDEIRQAERWLADLGYWTGPADGVWDDVSRHALVAFQKVQHAKATGKLTRAEYNALSVATPPRPRELGEHIEVDLARQVLFLVDAEG